VRAPACQHWVSGDVFLLAYPSNRDAANEIALETSLIAEAVKELATDGWQGSAQEFIIALCTKSKNRVNYRIPQTPRGVREPWNASSRTFVRRG
jgi:hypothetical protein